MRCIVRRRQVHRRHIPSSSGSTSLIREAGHCVSYVTERHKSAGRKTGSVRRASILREPGFGPVVQRQSENFRSMHKSFFSTKLTHIPMIFLNCYINKRCNRRPCHAVWTGRSAVQSSMTSTLSAQQSPKNFGKSHKMASGSSPATSSRLTDRLVPRI